MTDKNTLRKELIEKRLAILPEIAAEAAAALAKHLQNIIPENSKVAGYCAMRGEIAVGIQLSALPVVVEGSRILKFLEYSGNSALVAGKYGTSCPAPHLPEVVPDVLIVPLVGFDAIGNRLGYGGGYYDATICALRSIKPELLVIGVGYDLQKLSSIPTQEHDEKMDMVVTESGVVK